MSDLAPIPDEAKFVLASYNSCKQTLLHRKEEVNHAASIIVHATGNSSRILTPTSYEKRRSHYASSTSGAVPSPSEQHQMKHEPYVFSGARRSPRITLRGMGGIGKTTLAALAIHNNFIRSSFSRICWINLGKSFNMKQFVPKLNLSLYLACLQRICMQIGVNTNEFQEDYKLLYRNRGNSSPMSKAAMEVRTMERAKDRMSLVVQGLTLLIVLDDVWDNGDCDWFDFNRDRVGFEAKVVLFVTTRTDDDFRFDRSIDISMNLLSKHDAICLFFMEASISTTPQPSSSCYSLALDIVKRCGFLPIAIKTAGRLVRYGLPGGAAIDLRDISKHVLMIPTFEREEYLESYTSVDPNVSRYHSIQLFHILDRTFAMVVSEALHYATSVYFSAFAIVFCQDEILRPWVTNELAQILWEELKGSKYLQKVNMYTSVSAHELLDGLRKIGVIDVNMSTNSGEMEDRKYRVSHDLMWEYGRQFASCMNNAEETTKEQTDAPATELFFSYFSALRFLNPKTTEKKKMHDTPIVEWNALIVNRFKVIVDRPPCDENISIVRTAFYALPTHMTNATQFDEVISLLVKEDFIRKRLSSLGLRDGTQRHIQDIKRINEYTQQENVELNTLNFSATYCLSFIADILWEMHIKRHPLDPIDMSVSHALIQVGMDLQNYASWTDATDSYYKAIEICRVAGCEEKHINVMHILRLIECSSLRRVILLSSKSPNCIIFKNTHLLKESPEKAVPLEMTGKFEGYALSPTSNEFTKPSMIKFLGVRCQHSILPPFRMYKIIEKVKKFPFLKYFFFNNEYVWLGCGLMLTKNALTVTYDGTLITRVTDGATLNVVLGIKKEGGAINIKPCSRNPEVRKKNAKSMNASRSFVINNNGSISPAGVPDVAFGVAPYPELILVKLNSPNRALFKKLNLSESRSDLKKSSEDTYELSLTSHQGYFIAPMTTEWPSCGPFCGSLLGLGPREEMVRLQHLQDGHIVLIGSGAFLEVYRGTFKEGEPCFALKTSSRISSIKQFGSKFTLNNDGSISPTGALHIALGFNTPYLRKRSSQEEKV